MLADSTVKWLVEEVGMPYNTLTNSMSKGRHPSIEMGYKIVAALGTTIEFLLTGEESYIDADHPQHLRQPLGPTIRGLAN